MAISKIIYQDSCEELVKATAANGEMMSTLIELSDGVKCASSALVSRQLLDKYKPKDDRTACIHLIAMGNSDQYGYNRNGDYFAGDVLEKRAHTFVTNGHVFREHRNKDPKNSIGRVKWAGYDPKGMQRVELIVHIDKDKAEEEYQMAKEGKALNFSMACRVPNDRCSCCGNEAKTITQYCDHLKNHMGQYIEGMQKYAFAYNDNPTFFDLSVVKTPADRIARHLEYVFSTGNKENEQQKVASEMLKSAAACGEQACIPSALAAMAEGINLDVFDISEQSMLTKLANSENFANDVQNFDRRNTDARAYNMYIVSPYAMMEKLSAAELDQLRQVEPGTLFREMAKRASIMSFPAFCQYIFNDINADEMPLVKKASLLLPGIFGSMMSKMMSMTPCTSLFYPSSESVASMDPKRDDLVQNVMEDMEQKFSVKEAPIKRRVMTIIIKSGSFNDNKASEFMKTAAAQAVPYENAKTLAEVYGQYQLSALCSIKDIYGDNTEDLCDLVVGGNNGINIDSF